MIGLRNGRQRRPRQRDVRYRRLGLEPVEGRLLLSAVLGDPLAEDEPNGQQPAETPGEDPDPAVRGDEEQAGALLAPGEGGFVPIEGNGHIALAGVWVLQATDAAVSHGGGSSEGIEIRRLDPGEFPPVGPDPGLIDLTWVAERPVEARGVPAAGNEGAARSPAVSAPRTRTGTRPDGISEGGSQGRSQAFELAVHSRQSDREPISAFNETEFAATQLRAQRSLRPATTRALTGANAGEDRPSTADNPHYRYDHGERFARPLREEVLLARQAGKFEETPRIPSTVLEAAPPAGPTEGVEATLEDAAEGDDPQVAYLENRRRDEAVPLVALAIVHWQLSRRFWHPYDEHPRRKNRRDPA